MASDSERGGWAPMVVLLVLIAGFVLLSLAVVIGFVYTASSESKSVLASVEHQRALAAEQQALAEARLRALEVQAARNADAAQSQTTRIPLKLDEVMQAQELVLKLSESRSQSDEAAKLLAPNFTAKTAGPAKGLPFGGDWLPRSTPTLIGVQPAGEKLRLHYVEWFGAQVEIDALVTIVSNGEQRLIESIEFVEAAKNPRPTTGAVGTGTTAGRGGRPALADPLPSEILVPLNQDAEPLSSRDLVDASDVARRFLGCLAINDINGMKAVATEHMQAQNPFNTLFNSFLHAGGFGQEPTLVAARLFGSQCTLQYRVRPGSAPQIDIIMSLMKKDGEFKVDYCNRHVSTSPEIRPKVEPRGIQEGIIK